MSQSTAHAIQIALAPLLECAAPQSQPSLEALVARTPAPSWSPKDGG